MTIATDVSAWRTTIAGTGIAGTLVFAALFAYSFVDPLFVESIARDIVRAEVQERVRARLDRLDGAALAGLAGRVTATNADAIAELERKLATAVPARVAAVAARMLDADCDCRGKIEAGVRGAFATRVAGLRQANERLEALIRAQYQDVAAALTREFRIFTGANALVFALLAAIAVARRKAGVQLVLPAAVLLVAAGGVGTLYLFGQDWLRTVLFGDYVGLWYFAYLGLAIAFLADVAFYRARVTTRLLNGLFQLLGMTFHVLPC